MDLILRLARDRRELKGRGRYRVGRREWRREYKKDIEERITHSPRSPGRAEHLLTKCGRKIGLNEDPGQKILTFVSEAFCARDGERWRRMRQPSMRSCLSDKSARLVFNPSTTPLKRAARAQAHGEHVSARAGARAGRPFVFTRQTRGIQSAHTLIGGGMYDAETRREWGWGEVRVTR